MRNLGKVYVGSFVCKNCGEIYIVKGKNLKVVIEELKSQSFRDGLKDMLLGKGKNEYSIKD